MSFFFFFKQKTAYEMRISDWSSDVCSSDLLHDEVQRFANVLKDLGVAKGDRVAIYMPMIPELPVAMLACARIGAPHSVVFGGFSPDSLIDRINRSEEHTSELQSLMRISYAVFCLKKKKPTLHTIQNK